jgi:DNA polymerase-3 subunit beta
MKFKIDQEHFKNGLAQVVGVVSNRGSMPVLNNVLIEAEGETVSLTTTNLDLGIRTRVKAEVSTSGAITLPVKLLNTIVTSLPPKKEVTVEISGSNRVRITSGGASFNINGLGTDGFPPLTTFANQHEFTIPAVDVLGILRKVYYAQSTDENRYVLNGVFFSFEGGRLTGVATDGRRLAIAGTEVPAALEQVSGFILPAKTVAEVQHLLADAGDVRISFNERQVSFISTITDDKSKSTGLVENIHLVSKIVEGNYPNYKQVIPKEVVHRIEIERLLFIEAIRRAAIVTNDKSGSVKVLVDNNLVTVSSESSEMGEASESIAIKYDGPAVKIAFNPGFILSPLNALTDDNIFLEFKDDMSPGVVKNTGDFLCVVMPQRA